MPDVWNEVGTYFTDQRNVVDGVRSFAHSLQRFDQLIGGLDVGRWLQSKSVKAGRTAVEQFVLGYGKVVPAKGYYADSRVFGREPADAPFARSALDAVWTLTAVLVAGASERVDMEAAIRLALGGDPASRAFLMVLTGMPWPGDDPHDGGGFPDPFPDIPDPFQLPPDKLGRLEAYGALQSALTELGRAGATFRPIRPYPGMTISGLDPKSGCPGDIIQITGVGFGTTQPSDAIVVFGSTRATVVAGSWTATRFSVVVPAAASECCVAILQTPQTGSGGTTLVTALSSLAGVLTKDFGTAGIAMGERLEGLIGRIPETESATCAADGSNRFIGGAPVINVFRTGVGGASPQRLLPGHGIDLHWSIANASSATLSIAPVGVNSPYAAIPSLPSWFVPDPTSGFLALPAASGLTPWTANITLTARNRCGSTSRALEVDFTPATGLVFVGGGMRSSFHLGAIEALALLLPLGPTVCSGTGLGALSAVCAAADYSNPASLRAFWNGPVDQQSLYMLAPSLNIPGGDLIALNTAQWQASVRAEVLSLGALGLIRLFMGPHIPGDARLADGVSSLIASKTADEITDALQPALTEALELAGAGALSSVPIVAIVVAAVRFGVTMYVDSIKQQTRDQLNALPGLYDDIGLRTLITVAMAGIDQRLAASGRKIRIPITSLEKGRALYGTEAAAISEAPVLSQIVTNLAAIEPIVQASAVTPLLASPLKLGMDNYIDGSIRDPVPIGATIEAGAGTVILIQPNIRAISTRPTFDMAGMPRIDARVTLTRDAQFLDAAVDVFGHFSSGPNGDTPVGSWRAPVVVIEPTVDLLGLGATFGQKGMVEIMIDYGYMRAFDTIAPWLLFPDPLNVPQTNSRDSLSAALGASTDAIIGLRVAAWEAEHKLNGARATPFGSTNKVNGGPLVAVPESDAIDEIRALKIQIHDALVARLAIPPISFAISPIPKPRAEQWYMGWEVLDFDRIVAPVTVTPAEPTGSPWVALNFGSVWSVPAATPPALLWP